MRRTAWTIAAMVLIVGWTAQAGLAQTTPTPQAGAGMTGSGHDFATASWNTSGETCRACHIPHSAVVTDIQNGVVLGAPLWNHTLSSNTSYILYQQSTSALITSPVSTFTAGQVTQTQGQTGQVDETTKVCLSCHDGTVALDSFGQDHGGPAKTTTTIGTVASWADVTGGTGNDLSKNHPYGDAARWPANNISGKGVAGVQDLVDPSKRAALGIMPLGKMYDGQSAVGCVSCHDPHNTDGYKDFLWLPNNISGTTADGRAVSGSLLCQNCHIK